jgi:hypothetical protein
MAEAAITLKLTPREFDLVRDVLASEARRAHEAAKDRDSDVKLRSEDRQLEVRLSELLSKLR